MSEQYTTFWLVRHGQTDWNRQGRYQGQTDQPLNQNGHQQAGEAAVFFGGRPIAAIYSSDLKRARQTAQAIAAVTGQKVHVDSRLREIHQGILEGELYPVILLKWPEVIAARRKNPIDAHPPGGESVRQVANRVLQAANEIATRHPGQEVVIASHGLALATLIVCANRIPLQKVFNHIPDNARPIRVEWRVDVPCEDLE